MGDAPGRKEKRKKKTSINISHNGQGSNNTAFDNGTVNVNSPDHKLEGNVKSHGLPNQQNHHQQKEQQHHQEQQQQHQQQQEHHRQQQLQHQNQQQHQQMLGQGACQMSPSLEVSSSAPKLQLQKKKLFILNNIDFPEKVYNITGGNIEEQILSRREGASVDSQNLMSTFQSLGYDVNLNENKTQSQTNTILDYIQQDQNLPFLLLIILSHGIDKDHFITSDGLPYSIKSIQQRFTDSACPTLMGLPKVVIYNFCRGSNIEEMARLPSQNYNETDAVPSPKEIPHHMITIHATHDGFAAIRNTKNGTVFVSNLCEVLREQGHQPIQETINQVFERIQQTRAQTPEMNVSYPFPKFSF